MTRILRTLWATSILAAVITGGTAPSFAKNVCGRLGAPNDNFYVLEKIKTRVGSHGAVSGYLVSADGASSSPFTGSYGVFSQQFIRVSMTVGVGSGGYGHGVRVHNFEAPLLPDGTSLDYPTLVNETPNEETAIDTFWADCKEVPRFLAPQ